jgi:hypothetical protein
MKRPKLDLGLGVGSTIYDLSLHGPGNKWYKVKRNVVDDRGYKLGSEYNVGTSARCCLCCCCLGLQHDKLQELVWATGDNNNKA